MNSLRTYVESLNKNKIKIRMQTKELSLIRSSPKDNNKKERLKFQKSN